MANYLLSQKLLDQIRSDHSNIKTQGQLTQKPTIGTGNSERFFAKIKGKYETAGIYPLGATYRAKQVITDSSGIFQEDADSLVWGEATSESLPPVVDIVSLGPYFSKDINRRIPDDTVVEVFLRGSTDGETFWYCEPPEQKVPISFQADFIFESSLDKVLINSGTVFGKGFSTHVIEEKFVISANLYIYVTYRVAFSTYVISVVELGSQTGRPDVITNTTTYREVKIPLVSFDSSLKMTRYHEGDIFIDDNWWDGTGGKVDFTYLSEHTESAVVDTGWKRYDPGTYSGVQLTIQTGTSYYETGDETIYGYFRDLTFDQEGKLVEISAETRVAIEVPEGC